MHCSPSKYQSCSVQRVGLGEGIGVGDSGVDSVVIVGFGVGQVGKVPHDGLIVGDIGVDSVVIDGSGVNSGVVGKGVTGSGVVSWAGEGLGVSFGKGSRVGSSVFNVDSSVGEGVGLSVGTGLIFSDSASVGLGEGFPAGFMVGSDVGSGVVDVGVKGYGVVGLVAVGSYVVTSRTEVGDGGEGPGVSMHTSQYIHSPSSKRANSQHFVRVSKYVISSGLSRISGLSYPLVHCFNSLKVIMYHLRPSQGVGEGLGIALILVSSVGIGLGFSVAIFVGSGEGSFVGFNVGSLVGEGVGSSVRTGLYTSVCTSVGLWESLLVGFHVGSSIGEGIMGKFEGK